MIIPKSIIRILIAGSIFVHGIAHLFALINLIIQSFGGVPAAKVSVRSWVFPAFTHKSTAATAIPFWFISSLGFLVAAAGFWGFLGEGIAWRQITIYSAIVSLLGIFIFSGIWPGSPNKPRMVLNTSIAVFFNIVLLVSLLLFQWPPADLFGK